MKYILPALLLIAGAAVTAQTTDEIRGKKVVDEAIQALGGEKFLTMRDRVETGRAYSFYNRQLSGLARATIYTRYLTPPDPPTPGFVGVRERQAFGKDEDWSVILNENGEGWELTYRGAKLLPKEQLERARESTLRNVFYILRMRLKEPGMIIESRGSDVVDNQPVEVVDFTDLENRVVRVYFHRSTKLPVKQLTYRRTGGERFEEVTYFSKYRDVGGVTWPLAIRRDRDGAKIFELFSERVEINKDLTDNLFTLPANVKILDEKN
jgi:hypothetical protein